MSGNKQQLLNVSDDLLDSDSSPSVLLGFDGFVDLIIHLVDERETVDDYVRLDDMTKFADLVREASGHSANVEMVPVRKKLGGNGPIMGNALLEAGANVTYIGALGADRIHPVFEEFHERCEQVFSLADPGHTEALEFNDGKLMLGKYQSLKNVNRERLLDTVGRERLASMLASSDLIASLNWTMVPYMNELLDELKELLSSVERDPWMFFDLADPRKRTEEDQQRILSHISEFEDCARVIFGVNEQESRQVAGVLGKEKIGNHEARAVEIRDELGVSRVVVHPVQSAHVATPEGAWSVQGPYTENPELTTGAGDNFNSGYCIGELAGCSPENALYAGVYTSGFYVRNARSPSREELVNFIRQQAEEI